MGFKGVILAGGKGTRLHPLTLVTNKHLLPVYDKPMIYHPLQTLVNAGIKEVLIISSPGELGHFVNLLGSGKQFGVQLSYEIQEEAGGIAQALGLAETFADGDNVFMVLGDNIIQDKVDISDFKGGCRLFLKEVPNPKDYGVAEINEMNQVRNIVEKPEFPKSNLAVIGLYVYDNSVFDIIRSIEPSARGELEITAVNNRYIERGQVDARKIQGYWKDAGSIKSLFEAGEFVKRSLEQQSI